MLDNHEAMVFINIVVSGYRSIYVVLIMASLLSE